ncbi:restriction endonuclease subunit S, partial [uncultured Prevotella sp.]|uniref:restriction endonuclease subunit S n=1 Tax=uncultured Prevotella sp. TaxID=159272 RepID=UPI0026111295
MVLVPNLRFPEFQGEWEKHELNDICETITDFVAAGSFASLRENVTYYQEDNYAQLVRTIDLKNNFSNNEFVYVDKGAYDFLWRVQLKEPNIVLPNIGANIGEKYYVRPQNLPKDKNVLGPNAILLRSESNDTHFVYFRLSTSSYDNEIKKLVGASGQPKFNKTDLKKVKVFMPTISEQKKISRFLALIDERIATQNKIIDKLQTLIKG